MVRAQRGGSAFGLALIRTLVLAGTLSLLVGCASGVAAGVTAVVVTIGFVSRTCYDHVKIKVFDGATGKRTCSAIVEVGRGDGGDDFTALDSCYHAQLPEGRWIVRANLADRVTETAEVVVPERSGCPHAVHTMEMTLAPRAAPYAPVPHAPAPQAPPPAPPAPPPPEPVPPPAEPVPSVVPAAPPAPAPSPASPGTAAGPSDDPATIPAPPPAVSAEPPPVQRFPDQP